MKLLYILKHFEKGGITTVLTNRLNYLAENAEFEIHVLSEFQNNDNLVSKISSKVQFHVLDLNGILSKKRLPILGYFFLKFELRKKYIHILNKINPDIITDFDWGFHRDILPTIKTKAIKIKELHGSYMSRNFLSDKKKLTTRFMDKNIFKNHNKYNLVITLTKEDLHDRKYLSTKTRHIYNPIKTNEKIKRDIAIRKNICLSVGTLTRNKNFKDLILAVSKIKGKLDTWEFHIYGEGIEEQKLQELIQELQLQEVVKLKGFCNSMEEVYDNAKLLVSTSLSEGLPMNLLEALSYSIPIVSYDSKCGAKEIIGKENGTLVQCGDIEKLSLSLLKYISNNEFLMTTSNNIDVSKFDNQKIMNEWVELYKTLAYDK